jgi:hypothetical protein
MSTKPALLLVAACANPPPPAEPAPPPPAIHASAETRVEQNLARLRALRIIYVGDLVVQPGETRARAAEQLEAFTEVAEAALREIPVSPSPDRYDVGPHLSKLRSLEVVEIGDLIEERPAHSGRCWGMCPEDVAAAKAVNAARAEKLQRIVAAELAVRFHVAEGK